METTLLAGPSQFTLEAWNYMWRHKRLLIILALLPWILETAAEYWFGMSSLNEDFFLSPLNKVFQPLWAMPWLHYILKPGNYPTTNTYFKLNINYAWYTLYGLALSVPFIGTAYVLKLFHVHLGIAFLVDILWDISTLMFLIIFPALAINKHIFVKDVWKLVQPFWGSFVKSALIGFFITMFLLAIFFLIISNIILVLQPNIPVFLSVAADNLYGIWSDAFLLTITGVYYKRYVMEQ